MPIPSFGGPESEEPGPAPPPGPTPSDPTPSDPADSFATDPHTHVAADVTDFSEAVDDRVAALLVAGSNVTLTYNDAANTLTVASSGGGGGTGNNYFPGGWV